jgi:hypothetical protein
MKGQPWFQNYTGVLWALALAERRNHETGSSGKRGSKQTLPSVVLLVSGFTGLRQSGCWSFVDVSSPEPGWSGSKQLWTHTHALPKFALWSSGVALTGAGRARFCSYSSRIQHQYIDISCIIVSELVSSFGVTVWMWLSLQSWDGYAKCRRQQYCKCLQMGLQDETLELFGTDFRHALLPMNGFSVFRRC